MFSTSSQRKYWTFASEEQLKLFRKNANLKYIYDRTSGKCTEATKLNFLTPDEEFLLVRYYEKVLRDFLQRFMPRREPLPRDIKGTSIHFFKRFYVVSSVMDYHPKDIMLTCIFLACKICEYCVPLELFVKHIDGNPIQLKNVILDQELELLYRLNFKLTIHTPYRAIDGLKIDLQTRSKLRRPERLNEHINNFLYSMWYTDICLLYTPALIALAAVMHAVTQCNENIDDFIVNTLLNNPSPTTLNGIINTVRKIRSIVMSLKESPTPEEAAPLQSRLAECRNPRNDPASKLFKRTMMEHALDSYRKEF